MPLPEPSHPNSGTRAHLKDFIGLQLFHAEDDAVAVASHTHGPTPIILKDHILAAAAVEAVGHARHWQRDNQEYTYLVARKTGHVDVQKLGTIKHGRREDSLASAAVSSAGALTWRMDGERLFGDVAGGQAVVHGSRGTGDGHLDTLAIQIDYSIDLCS